MLLQPCCVLLATSNPIEWLVLPETDELKGGSWRQSIIDAAHSNVWNDVNKPELFVGPKQSIPEQGFSFQSLLRANSIALVELEGKKLTPLGPAVACFPGRIRSCTTPEPPLRW